MSALVETAHDVLFDIGQIFVDHTSADGWDNCEITEAVDRYLRKRGYKLPDSDALTFQCSECGRIGSADDLCENGEPCPDEECSGTCSTYWETPG